MKRPLDIQMTAGAVLCLLLILLERTGATTLTNLLNAPSVQSLAINVGDTVVWVNQQPLEFGTNYVESYGGEWKSPPMNPGDSFSFTFTNAGFYAYRTGLRAFAWAAGAVPQAGVVIVMGWTDALPAVTINYPIEGLVIPNGIYAGASVTNVGNVARVEFFSDSTLAGTATNTPYQLTWQPASPGPHVLSAKAVDNQGQVAWSRPVNIITGPHRRVSGVRVLPTGEMQFVDNTFPARVAFEIGTSDDPTFSHYTPLARVISPGVFVDESVRAGVQRRFYTLTSGP